MLKVRRVKIQHLSMRHGPHMSLFLSSTWDFAVTLPTPAKDVWDRSRPHRVSSQTCFQSQSPQLKPQLLWDLSNAFSPFFFSPSLCSYEGFTKRLRFFGQAIDVVTQPSQGLSVNESDTCGLNFPQTWIHMHLEIKGKIVFPKTWFEFWKTPSAGKIV